MCTAIATPRRPDMTTASLPRRLAAEALGTALLLATVVGSGIMGETLSGGNVAIALLANTIATGAALVALILTFGPISGAHFNPAVTLFLGRQVPGGWRDVPRYVAAQVIGAMAGVFLAHVMFEQGAWFQASAHMRAGTGQLVSEFVATFGLLSVIAGSSRSPNALPFAPFAVGLYITAAYWFTASTSFANPAVTLARSFTNTFAGIRPIDVPAFITVQLVATAAALVFWHWLAPDSCPPPDRPPLRTGPTTGASQP